MVAFVADETGDIMVREKCPDVTSAGFPSCLVDINDEGVEAEDTFAIGVSIPLGIVLNCEIEVISY